MQTCYQVQDKDVLLINWQKLKSFTFNGPFKVKKVKVAVAVSLQLTWGAQHRNSLPLTTAEPATTASQTI